VSIRDEKDMIEKYRSLIAGLKEQEEAGRRNKGDMEISWVDKTNEEAGVAFAGDGDAVDDEKEAEKDMTPWEKYLQKKEDKKKRRKEKLKAQEDKDGGGDDEDEIPDDVDLNDPFFAEELGDTKQLPKKDKKNKKKKKRKDGDDGGDEQEPSASNGLELLVMDSDDEQAQKHFNYKTLVAEESQQPGKKKKKWKKKTKRQQQLLAAAAAAEGGGQPDSFEVDVSDDRFAALFVRPEFNIDPSEPSFKRTKAMERLIGEKQKRIAATDGGGGGGGGSSTTFGGERSSESKRSRLDPELSSALKSVKNKWKKNAKTKHS
jgi:hypothetical protein